jgi:hypothetical protein
VIVLTAIAILLPLSVQGQTPSQFCGNNGDDRSSSVFLEVSRLGRGMVFPNLVPQLFFRVSDNGRIEYQVRSKGRTRTKSGRISQSAVLELKELLEGKDFTNAREEYPLVEGLGDAIMKLCITYKTGERYNRILVVNYMPRHPKAVNYYPASLVKILDKVQGLRPKSEYEHRYALDRLDFQ